MYNIIQKRKIWFSVSSLLVIFSIISIIFIGIKLGIDFTGGSLLEVEFGAEVEVPGVVVVQDKLKNLELGSLSVQPAGEKGMILRFQEASEEKHQQVLAQLNELVGSSGVKEDIKVEVEGGGKIDNVNLEIAKNVSELRFDSVGPSVGQELKKKSIYAVITVIIAIIIYIAWAFRKVSKPVESWKYGVVAVVALFHDVIITLGVFVLLGKYLGTEINTPFIAAILTVLGYSVNDTIVIFDRTRENIPKSDHDFEKTVNVSVNQTISRSINTAFTTILVLVSIVLFGGATIRDFALALSIGIFVGTYSSIFLASPLLVFWEKMKK